VISTKPSFSPFFIATLFVAISAISTGATAQKTQKSQAAPSKRATQPALAGPTYARRDDAMLVADDIALRLQLDPAWVRAMIGQARYMPQVAKFIQPPPAGTAKNWRVYRSRFIDAHRIQAGVKFWQDNQDSLARAELETGVPAEIIVGIIGVETIYGQQTGTFRVVDALSTLAFDFPATHPRAAQRSAFFKNELAEFLSLTHRTGMDPTATLGSFAGAMGMPQFMPSSWTKYAVDFDADGKVDLFRSTADVIGSVANYFVAFNWQTGMPTHYSVTFNADSLNMSALMAPDILPTFSVADLAEKGAMVGGEGMNHKGPLALVELQNGDAEPSFVAGTENFYAITRYNWSSYYAMAVIELGRDVKAAMTSSR